MESVEHSLARETKIANFSLFAEFNNAWTYSNQKMNLINRLKILKKTCGKQNMEKYKKLRRTICIKNSYICA